jgi:SPP1 gp7 family putative phage head morphogenesis protein
MRKSRRTYQAILDDATRHQVLLERLKTSMVQDILASEVKVERAIAQTLRDLESDLLSDLTRRDLDRLLDDLRQKQLEIYAEQTKRLVDKLKDTATFSAEREAGVLDSWVTRLADESDKFIVPSASAVWKTVESRPVRATGQLLEGFVEGHSLASIKRVEGAIRNGWAEGKTNGQLVREVLGTKKANYKDGLAMTNRREAETVVRTAVQHVANTARQATWEANKDVVKGYVWIATLDSVTTTACRSLDQQKFLLGKGPVPPLHPNCRSTTIADLGPAFDILSKGATRSSVDGYVPAKMSYYDWLKTQDREFVADAIGKTRAQLFLDGGLSADQFAKLNLGRNFEPLTLVEMRERDAAAFKRAGL